MKYGLIAALALSLSMGLAGCSMLPGGAPTPTAAAPDYTAEMVSANRYRITYTGPEDAKPALIADRALARAAQVTLDKGNEWFEIASKVSGPHSQTLVIVMGKGETLAGGPQMHDAKETLSRLKGRIS
jgi:hypothetical protein